MYVGYVTVPAGMPTLYLAQSTLGERAPLKLESVLRNFWSQILKILNFIGSKYLKKRLRTLETYKTILF